MRQYPRRHLRNVLLPRVSPPPPPPVLWFIQTWTLLPEPWICCCQVHYARRSLFIIHALLYWLTCGCGINLIHFSCGSMQFREQLGVRPGLSGCGGSAAKVPLFLSGSENHQRPGRGRLRLGHSQLLGRSPQTGLHTHTHRMYVPCKFVHSLLPCTDFTAFLSLLQSLQTRGALDLGGASTQISFVSSKFDGSESPDNGVTFRLYGNVYNVYTHSFLCYGKDQALRMTLAQHD